jgi:hypothetical protein
VKNTGLLPTIFVIALTSWAASARVLRGQTLSVLNRDYVLELSGIASGGRGSAGRPVKARIAVESTPCRISGLISWLVEAVPPDA